jgi:hypothetical protein
MLIRALSLPWLVVLLTMSLTPIMASANLIEEIVIVKDSDNTYFDKTITTLARQVKHIARIQP